MKEDPPLDAKCRDKFLVQSVAITNNDDPNNVANIWSTVEKTSKSSIAERKIRVNFLPAGGTAGGAASSVNGVNSNHEEEPPAYSSPSPTQFGSPAPQTTTETVKSTMGNAAEATGLTAAATAVSNAMPSSDDVKQQLAAANAQIQKLTSQMANPEKARQTTSNMAESVTAVSDDGGVPLPIVAGLCLLSFLIAYLFF